MAYKLALPSTWRVHPVFHQSLLKPFEGKIPRHLSLPQVEPSYKYEVEKILKERMVKGKNQFLVKWKHYLVKEATWQNEEDCSNCQHLILSFHSSLMSKSLGGNVMNLKDSPSGPIRLLSILDSITITKVNNIKANSSKYFIRAFIGN